MRNRAIRGMTHAQKNLERKSKMLVHTLDGRQLERFFLPKIIVILDSG